MVHFLLYFFQYSVYFSVFTSYKIFFSPIKTSSLPRGQRFFSKIKLVKILLHTQLKQTDLENLLHISTESPKKVLMILFFNILWILSNPDMGMDLQLVPVLLYLFTFIYVQYSWLLGYLLE